MPIICYRHVVIFHRHVIISYRHVILPRFSLSPALCRSRPKKSQENCHTNPVRTSGRDSPALPLVCPSLPCHFLPCALVGPSLSPLIVLALPCPTLPCQQASRERRERPGRQDGPVPPLLELFAPLKNVLFDVLYLVVFMVHSSGVPLVTLSGLQSRFGDKPVKF